MLIFTQSKSWKSSFAVRKWGKNEINSMNLWHTEDAIDGINISGYRPLYSSCWNLLFASDLNFGNNVSFPAAVFHHSPLPLRGRWRLACILCSSGYIVTFTLTLFSFHPLSFLLTNNYWLCRSSYGVMMYFKFKHDKLWLFYPRIAPILPTKCLF